MRKVDLNSVGVIVLLLQLLISSNALDYSPLFHYQSSHLLQVVNIFQVDSSKYFIFQEALANLEVEVDLLLSLWLVNVKLELIYVLKAELSWSMTLESIQTTHYGNRYDY